MAKVWNRFNSQPDRSIPKLLEALHQVVLILRLTLAGRLDLPAHLGLARNPVSDLVSIQCICGHRIWSVVGSVLVSLGTVRTVDSHDVPVD